MAKRLSTLLLLISVFTTLSAQHSTELGFYPVFTTLEFSEVLEKFPTTIKQRSFIETKIPLPTLQTL